MSAPVTNATITQVAGPGTIDRYGDQASTTTLWTGSISGYLRRARQARTGGEVEHDEKTDELVLQADHANPILPSLASGADSQAVTVTITDLRQPTKVINTYLVKGLQVLAAGTPADSVRLTLKREDPA